MQRHLQHAKVKKSFYKNSRQFSMNGKEAVDIGIDLGRQMKRRESRSKRARWSKIIRTKELLNTKDVEA